MSNRHSLTCPHCRRSGKASSKLKDGMRVRCPSCKQPFACVAPPDPGAIPLPPHDDLDGTPGDSEDSLLFDTPPPDGFLDDEPGSAAAPWAAAPDADPGQPDLSAQASPHPSMTDQGLVTTALSPAEYDSSKEPWFFNVLDNLGTVQLYVSVLVAVLGVLTSLMELTEDSRGIEALMTMLGTFLFWEGLALSILSFAGLLKLAVNAGRNLRMIRQSVFGPAQNA